MVMRSPTPDSPMKVSGWPPRAMPRRVISASPLVTRAAMALSPSPIPAAIPAAMAKTFLRAPPSSIPATSSDV